VKSVILIILTILSIPLLVQQKDGFEPDFRLSQTSAVSSGKDLPFWMTSNQNGVYALHNSSYFLLQAGLNRSLDRDTLKKWVARIWFMELQAPLILNPMNTGLGSGSTS
jgi:hypothetical protein